MQSMANFVAIVKIAAFAGLIGVDR